MNTGNIDQAKLNVIKYKRDGHNRVVHGSDGPAGRVGSGRVTILPDFGGSGRVGSALRIL